MPAKRKILSIQCAGLGHELAKEHPVIGQSCRMTFQAIRPVFPAVTATVQATMRTALPPGRHGIVSSGYFDRLSCQVNLENPSAHLIQGPRIWETLQAKGGTVALLFQQHSFGERADMMLAPLPLQASRGKIVYSLCGQPEDIELLMGLKLQRPFPGGNYWGPQANHASSQWIAEATLALMRDREPDFVMTCLPHLDFCLQRHGPNNHTALCRQTALLGSMLEQLTTAAVRMGYEVLVWGDHAVTAVRGVIMPNLLLREANLLKCHKTGDICQPDLFGSRAFAVTDHQIAHVYVPCKADIPLVSTVLNIASDGHFSVHSPQSLDMQHPFCGDIVLAAKSGYWFAYPWWKNRQEAPNYLGHIDLQHKLGSDPCELLWQLPRLKVCTDSSRPQGTFGRADSPVALGTTEGLRELRKATSHLELAEGLRNLLSESHAD